MNKYIFLILLNSLQIVLLIFAEVFIAFLLIVYIEIFIFQ